MARSRPQIPLLVSTAALAEGDPRGSIGRSTYQTLRSAILDCTFTPGMALSEQSVSEELEVSRAPVREAFRRLVMEGLLESAPQRGTYVARLHRGRIADAIFVREAIECRAAELSARAPLEQRRELTQIVQRQSRAQKRKDYTEHLETDEAFHHRILELAGHPHAWPALRLARLGMNRIRHLAIPAVGSPKLAVDHHRVIADAIVEGNARSASSAMRLHIHSPLEYLEAIQREHPEYFETT